VARLVEPNFLRPKPAPGNGLDPYVGALAAQTPGNLPGNQFVTGIGHQ
jgi:hypothetical protein